MNHYLAIPNDPLLFGTGRPFSAVAGSRASSLPMPIPTQVAGLTRSRTGRDAEGRFDTSRLDELLNLTIEGPFLATVGADDALSLCFPPPADAVVVLFDPPPAKKGDLDARVRRLKPLKLDDTDAVPDPELAPVGLTPSDLRKAWSSPVFWTSEQLTKWLAAPADDDVRTQEYVALPKEEVRTHVVTQQGGGVVDGGLFQTAGMRFVTEIKQTTKVGAKVTVKTEPTQLALYWRTDADLPLGMGRLGGEARTVTLSRTDDLLPPCPAAVLKSADNGFVRLYMATPGAFGGSSLPESTAYEVIAQSHGSPVTVSGWAMHPQDDGDDRYDKARVKTRRGGSPKATRRLVPAGAVYFLKLTGSPDANRAFVTTHWGRSILPPSQDARDGFGMALFGTWDGQLVPLTLARGSHV